MRRISAQQKRHQVKRAMKGQNRWFPPRSKQPRLTEQPPRSSTLQSVEMAGSAWISSTDKAIC